MDAKKKQIDAVPSIYEARAPENVNGCTREDGVPVENNDEMTGLEELFEKDSDQSPERDKKADVLFKDEPFQKPMKFCKHEHTIAVPIFNVRGETRRVIKKCLDCAEILETENVGR